MSTPPLPAGYALDAEPAVPSGYTLDQSKQYAPGREVGIRVAKGMGLDADAIAAAEDKGGEGAAWKEFGSQMLRGLKNIVKDPLSPITGAASNIEEAIKSRDWAQMVGAVSGVLGGAEAREGTAIPGRAGETVSTAIQAPGAAREAVGAALHTPEGELRPTIRRASELAGGGAGATIGHTVAGYPGMAVGAGFGAGLGPSLMERMFPEPKSAVEMRQQAAAYQARAEDLMRRGKEQDILDRKQAIAEKRAAQLTKIAKQPIGPEAPEPVKTSPFAGMQSTAPSATTALPRQALPQGTPTPFQAPQAPQFVSKFEAQEPGRIVTPESTPPDIKVTYQSVPQAELLQKVKGGDMYAIREWQRRGLTLPPNVRFMLEQSGTQPWRAYSK